MTITSLPLKKVLCVLLTLLILLPFTSLTGFCHYESVTQREIDRHETPEWLFYEDLNRDEQLSERRTSQKPVYNRYYAGYEFVTETVDVPFVTRTIERSLKLESDVKIIKLVQVEVPSNVTLTIPKGVTMTIEGGLVVKGTLDNKGTIIIGNSKTKQIKKDDIISSIYNTGKITNAGNIQIVCGQLPCDGGDLENKGTITITNKIDSLTALSIQSINKSAGLKGEIKNTGTIHVKNVEGNGIYVFGKSVFTNDGTVYKTEKATIKGKITGNAPMAEPVKAN